MNKTGLKLINDDSQNTSFSPAVLNKSKEISLFSAIFYSIFIHIFGGGFLACLITVLMFFIQLLGINLDLFKKPELKPKDIEFVLVNKEAKPINPNTKYRADRNSRAGGIHDPKKKVSMPTVPSKKSAPQQQKTTTKQKKMEKLLPKRPMLNPPTPPKPQAKQAPQKPQPTKTQAPAKTQTSAQPPKMPPKPTPPAAFNIPRPEMPKSATTPTQGRSTAGQRASGASSSGGAGMPSGRYNSPYSAGSGSLGNPSPGNPKGAPGVDAIAEPDFGPYMRELQAKIKRNWDPPKSNQSKRTVLIFTIAKDGRLLNTRIYKSSGIPAVDKAALSAVEYSAPFKPLPREFKGSDIDIHFTFDYNVFGGNLR